MKYAIGLALLVLSVAAQACGCGGAGLAEETYRWSREVRLEMLWWGVGVTLAVFGFFHFFCQAFFNDWCDERFSRF